MARAFHVYSANELWVPHISLVFREMWGAQGSWRGVILIEFLTIPTGLQ
jgi:hypothetical protein